MKRRTVQSLLLTALLLVSLGAVGVTALEMTGTNNVVVSTASTDITTVDRTIDQSELQPGETTTVTVDVVLNQSGSPVVNETFDSGATNAQIVSESPTPAASAINNAGNELFAAWDSTNTAIIEYEVTVPTSASAGDTFTLGGEVQTASGSSVITGDDTITVVDQQPAMYQVVNLDAPASIAVDETSMDVTATIENTGDTAGNQPIMHLLDDNVISITDTLELQSGEQATYTFEVDTTDLSESEHTHGVYTDADEQEATLTVDEIDQPIGNVDPTADAGPDRTVSVDDAVDFDGTDSTDDVGISSYEWDLIDGSTETGATPTHSYDSPGTYTATLTVSDDAGNTETDTVTITVEKQADDDKDDSEEEQADDGEDDQSDTVPGFGILVAVMALLTVVYIRSVGGRNR